MKRDANAGVRGRAATVLGECGGPEVLPALWQQALAGSEDRVQEKAWDAFAEVVARAGSVALAEGWDRRLADAKQGSRRAQLWARLHARWEQAGTMREQATQALAAQAQAEVELGRWSAAAPLVQALLVRTAEAGEAQRAKALRWLAQVVEGLLKEGQRAEALRLAQEARGYLSKGDKLAEVFDRLQRQAAGQGVKRNRPGRRLDSQGEAADHGTALTGRCRNGRAIG